MDYKTIPPYPKFLTPAELDIGDTLHLLLEKPFAAWSNETEEIVNFDLEDLREYHLERSNGVANKTNEQGEPIQYVHNKHFTLEKRSAEGILKMDNRVKYAIAADLIRNGVPICHLPSPSITYTFQNTTYEFEPEILQYALDAMKYASDEQMSREAAIHKLNMCVHPILIPCFSGEKTVIFKAQYKSASQLYDLLREYCFTWSGIRNILLNDISEFNLTSMNNPYKELYMRVYGVDFSNDPLWDQQLRRVRRVNLH